MAGQQSKPPPSLLLWHGLNQSQQEGYPIMNNVEQGSHFAAPKEIRAPGQVMSGELPAPSEKDQRLEIQVHSLKVESSKSL